MVTDHLAMYEGVRGGRFQHLESGDNSSSLSARSRHGGGGCGDSRQKTFSRCFFSRQFKSRGHQLMLCLANQSLCLHVNKPRTVLSRIRVLPP